MTSAAPSATSAAPERTAIRRLLRATEVDTRMIGMIGALAADLGRVQHLHAGPDRRGPVPHAAQPLEFERPDVSIAIMATGMVLDHRDAPHRPLGRIDHRLRLDHHRRRAGPYSAGLSRPRQSGDLGHRGLIALAIGAAIGAFHGSLVAYVGIPAFIVTLGGQLFWRGAAWWVTTGQTIAPLDDRFALMGGGPHGSIGATASWVLAALACAGIVFGLYAGRRGGRAFVFRNGRCGPNMSIAVVGCFVVLGATAIVNAYPWPERVAANYASRQHSRCRKAACSFPPATRSRC